MKNQLKALSHTLSTRGKSCSLPPQICHCLERLLVVATEKGCYRHFVSRGQGAAKYLTIHGTLHLPASKTIQNPTRNYLAPNVNSTNVEQFY